MEPPTYILTVWVESTLLLFRSTTPVTGSTSSVTWGMVGTPGATVSMISTPEGLVTAPRSEERRVGKEWRVGRSRLHDVTVRSDVFWPAATVWMNIWQLPPEPTV